MSKPVIPMPVGKNITISKDGIVLYLKDLGDALIDSLPQWIIGICFILIGWKLSTKLVGVIERLMARRDTEPGLQSFLRSLSSALLKTCFVITGAGIMGLNTAGISNHFRCSRIGYWLGPAGRIIQFCRRCADIII